jgi:hypothetical protein
MTEHTVVIAGGGPTGMMLAAELALAGVDAAIVERRASEDLPGSRAGGLHSRTIEVLDQRGIADLFLSEGQVYPAVSFSGISLINLGAPGGFDIVPWADRVQLIDAKYAGTWELPVLGEVAAPPAVLVRPDGHVAWTGDPAHPGLPDALTTWFGPPAPA